MELFEKTIRSEVKFQGRLLTLCKDEVELEDGRHSSREYVKHSGGVSVLALTDEDETFLVRQFRYPYHKVILETPAGKRNPGEDPLECGKRELEEEVGITADNYLPMGECYPSVGYTDEVIYLYLATGLHATKQHLDPGEFLRVEKMPLKQLVEKVMNGEIADSKTQILALKAAALRGLL